MRPYCHSHPSLFSLLSILRSPLLLLPLLLLTACKPQSSSSPTPTSPTAPASSAASLSVSHLTLISPWWDVHARLLLLDPPGPPFLHGHAVTVPAKFAGYEFTTTQSSGGSFVTRLPVMVFADPRSGRATVISGNPLMFYVAAPSGFSAYSAGPTLDWNTSLLELPAAAGNLDAAIARFPSSFNHASLANSAGPSPLLAHALSLASAAPPFYFSKKPASTAPVTDAVVDSVDLANGTLRLAVHNPVTKTPATFWIDLPTQTVSQTTIAGRPFNPSAK